MLFDVLFEISLAWRPVILSISFSKSTQKWLIVMAGTTYRRTNVSIKAARHGGGCLEEIARFRAREQQRQRIHSFTPLMAL
jgi:hypothetical protein